MILDFNYVYEKYKLNVSGLIHIGAHRGYEVEKYNNLGITNIILFEPLSENFKELTEIIKSAKGNISAYQVALGNDRGKVVMNISSNEAQSSSILNPKVHLTAHPEVSFSGTEEVELKKLDDYEITNCNMMVIDVQGYELEAFKGAVETLNHIDYIYCEVNRDEVYEGNARVEQIDEFLSTYGFERVETQWYYTEVWGDALYMKNKKKVENSKQNVSIICACKNRYEALKLSLNSWVMFDEVKEIIIVDWSSDNLITDLLKLDERIKIIRVNGKKYFNLSQPLNLAASFATGDYILKLDCDYLINPYYNFFDNYKIDDTCFLTGNPAYRNYKGKFDENNLDLCNMNIVEIADYTNSYTHYFRYLKGLLYVSRSNFQRVGGFDESIQSYGWEDGEIIFRLESLNLEHTKLYFDYSIMHLPHPDKKRFEHCDNYSSEEEDYLYEAMRNQYPPEELPHQVDYVMVNTMTETNKNKLIEENKIFCDTKNHYIEPETKWDFTQINQNYYLAEEKNMEMVVNVVNKSILEYFPSVYYVTLEESTDRQRVLEQEFSKYGIQPKAIKSKRFAEENDNIQGKYVYQLNDGTKGCCVSHLKAIKEWYNTTDEDYAFFCEDDISLETVQYWDFTWEQFIEALPEDAECVQLFTIRDNYDTFELRGRYWDDWGASAYIITRDYAKKIIDAYVKNDHYLLEVPNQEVMPLIENMLFACLGKTYTIPLLVENVKFGSTFEGADDDVKDGHKNNHVIARNLVLNHFKKKINLIEESKLEIEKLLTDYSLDTENAEHNFNLAMWYENQGHTAPALSYFLRCAERSEDADLAYEALIRGSYCYAAQGERDGSTRSLLFQAQAFRPDRPEAYYLLSRYAQKREWWQDCYITADSALRNCNFEQNPLRTDVGYPGKYGLLYEKATSGWWWGKGNESRLLLQEIKNNYTVNAEHYDVIQHDLLNLATGFISEDELKYNKNRGQQLRFEFDGCDKIEKNYSQSFQDLFVLSALNGKRNGLYLEIGAQQPFYQNNTALLETDFNWNGISIEIREDLCKMFSEQRKNKILCQDATKVDYLNLLNEFGCGTVFDYLQLDCEPSEVTYNILLMIPFDHYKFAIITYEHDDYVDLSKTYKNKSREYLKKMGYELLVSDVSLNEWATFEDWWYHPDLIDSKTVEKMKSTSGLTDVRSYMIK